MLYVSVIALTLLRTTKYAVSLRDLNEAIGRLGIVRVVVGMMGFGKLIKLPD